MYNNDRQKTWTGILSLLLPVLARISEACLDFILIFWFWNQEDYSWSCIQAFSVFVTACVGAYIARLRHTHFEKNHPPKMATILGFLQLQSFLEVLDSIMAGKKTNALRVLSNYAIMTASIPSACLQAYAGFQRDEGWSNLLALSVFLKFVFIVSTVTSAERDLYMKQGLEKLQTCSIFSVVLFMYRVIELPARILSLALFAAAFGGFFVLLLALDAGALVLIRISSLRRAQDKRERSRKAISLSLKAVSAAKDVNVEDLDIFNQSYTVFEMSRGELAAHMLIWLFAYLDGIDINPYLLLRMIESIGMVSAFFLFVDDYQDKFFDRHTSLIVTLVFVILYLVAASMWSYFRSHAAYLQPEFRTPESIAMRVLERIEDNHKNDQLDNDEGLMPAELPVRRPYDVHNDIDSDTASDIDMNGDIVTTHDGNAETLPAMVQSYDNSEALLASGNYPTGPSSRAMAATAQGLDTHVAVAESAQRVVVRQIVLEVEAPPHGFGTRGTQTRNVDDSDQDEDVAENPSATVLSLKPSKSGSDRNRPSKFRSQAGCNACHIQPGPAGTIEADLSAAQASDDDLQEDEDCIIM
jgi:XK-related protein